MRIPLLPPLLRAAIGAVDTVAGCRLSIVIFHRVLPQPDPLFPGEMHAAQFDSLCARLAGCFRVLSLREAMAAMDAGSLPRRALVITFDDGYADNATVALPILQRHRLKATFFVATGFLDGGRMWNDTVIEALRSTRHEVVDVPELGLAAHPLLSVAERRAAIDRALPAVKYLSLDQREQALRSLLSALGEPTLPDDLMMSSDQVCRLHGAGMEIGGHTERHPILRAIGDAEAMAEIRQGRERLQALTNAPVDSFAYPNGGPDRDYDLRHVAMVRRAGFRVAVSTAHGVVTADSDRLQLPRFSPWDRSAERWVTRLALKRLIGARGRLATQG